MAQTIEVAPQPASAAREAVDRVIASKRRGAIADTERRRRINLSAQDEFERTRTADAKLGGIMPTADLERHREAQHKLMDPAGSKKNRHHSVCPISYLFARSIIDAAEKMAAEEIARVYLAITSGLFSKAASWGQVRLGRGDGMLIPDAYALRYRPWANTLSGIAEGAMDPDQLAGILPPPLVDLIAWARHTATTPEPRRCEAQPEVFPVVIDVVVEGRSLSEVSLARGWRNGKAGKLLKSGLELYVAMAGWNDQKNRHAANR